MPNRTNTRKNKMTSLPTDSIATPSTEAPPAEADAAVADLQIDVRPASMTLAVPETGDTATGKNEDQQPANDAAVPNGQLDTREQLCNERQTGPAPQVSLCRERITQLHGVMFDLDPKLLAPDNPLFPPDDEPAAFYAKIQPVLDRHPLARSAEVRSSGTGLHGILWLQPAVELRSAADQECWDGLVRAV
jgi:hypothetical protein